MELHIYRSFEGGPTPFRVRCQLDLGSHSSEERWLLAKFGAPPLTEPPLEFDGEGPILLSDSLA